MDDVPANEAIVANVENAMVTHGAGSYDHRNLRDALVAFVASERAKAFAEGEDRGEEIGYNSACVFLDADAEELGEAHRLLKAWYGWWVTGRDARGRPGQLEPGYWDDGPHPEVIRDTRGLWI